MYQTIIFVSQKAIEMCTEVEDLLIISQSYLMKKNLLGLPKLPRKPESRVPQIRKLRIFSGSLS
jgi:hypothetical protein